MLSIHYKISVKVPHSHYARVEMYISNIYAKKEFLEIKMPVWTPGSYLVREYTKNVESVEVFELGENNENNNAKNAIPFQKTRKNIWKIDLKNLPKNEEKNIVFVYDVYCFEHSVRTNWIDKDHIFINGASTFMYLEEYRDLPFEIEIDTPDFQYIHTALEKIVPKSANTKQITKKLSAKNYDELVDSPIEINNTAPLVLEINNIPHSFCFFGLDMTEELEARFRHDLEKVVQSATNIFGTNPCTHYTTISHFVHKGYGGLEHLFSTALIFERDNIRTEDGYLKFVTLFAHEYFHLWNVKRLCPQALTNFDYDNENYTELLWQVEGFTTYFQDIIMRKAGLITAEKFRNIQLERIKNITKNFGTKIQSLSESSWDTWIKFYRPNENTENANVSYYVKGAVIALMLDILIIENSDKSMEDLLKHLYEIFYLNPLENKQKIGFMTNSLKKELEIFTNQNLDEFFKKYIDGTDEIPFNDFLEKIGLKLEIVNTEKMILGITQQVLDASNDKKVTVVRRESPAYHLGLQVGDQLIAVNGNVENNLSEFLENQQPNSPIEIAILRDGRLITLKGNLVASYESEYKLEELPEISEKTKEKLEKWERNV